MASEAPSPETGLTESLGRLFDRLKSRPLPAALMDVVDQLDKAQAAHTPTLADVEA